MKKRDYLSSKELLLYIFNGYLTLHLVLGIPFMVLSFTGIIPVEFNEQSRTGMIGALIILVWILFSVVLLTFFNWLALVIGVWISNKFNELLIGS
jgi:hypothetical protein